MVLYVVMIGVKLVILFNVFDVWVIVIILGWYSFINLLYFMLLMIKLFLIGKIISFVLVCFVSCCYGIMLVWCLIVEIVILLFGLSCEVRLFVIKLIDLVVFLVYINLLVLIEK